MTSLLHSLFKEIHQIYCDLHVNVVKSETDLPLSLCYLSSCDFGECIWSHLTAFGHHVVIIVSSTFYALYPHIYIYISSLLVVWGQQWCKHQQQQYHTIEIPTFPVRVIPTMEIFHHCTQDDIRQICSLSLQRQPIRMLVSHVTELTSYN